MKLHDLFDLTGRVAIITGGASGLGLQMATALAEAGANVVLASRREKLCNEISTKLAKQYGSKTLAVSVDVNNEEDIVKMISKVKEYYNRIDILVNNSGGSIVSATTDTSLEDWNKIIQLNLTSTFLCCREAGKMMIEQKSGKIINIASVYGLMGVNWQNHVPPHITDYEILSYSSTKGGIINLTRDLAANWAKYNINVNAISPGGFKTEQRSRSGNLKHLDPEYSRAKFNFAIPLKRFGGDDDLKGAIVFLASDAGKYVVGHNLVVDGGWSIW